MDEFFMESMLMINTKPIGSKIKGRALKSGSCIFILSVLLFNGNAGYGATSGNARQSEDLNQRMLEVTTRFHALPPEQDEAYAMPVGNGDLTAMLRYDDAYHIHLSKQDFLGIDHPDRAFHWAQKANSPGHVKLDFGLERSEIQEFEQYVDYYRGSVVLNLQTRDGLIRAETYGVMDGSALIVAVQDSREKRTAHAEYSTWRVLNDPVNPIKIIAENNRIQVEEVRKYDSTKREPADIKRLDPYNVYYNLGAGTQMAFARGNTLLAAKTDVKDGMASLEASRPGSTYYLIIACSTSYDGTPGLIATKKLAQTIVKDKQVLLDEHLAWWKAYWKTSYVNLSGPHADRIMDAWLHSKYMYGVVGNNPIPPQFNGGGFILHEDHVSWGASYYWQNCRMMIWANLVGNHLDYAKDYLEYYNHYIPVNKANAERSGKIGIRHREAHPAIKARPAAAMKASAFSFNELEKVLPNPGIEAIPGFNANARSVAQAAELTQQMFDYVAFSGDEEFMNRVAVVWLKEAALFYLSHLQLEDGKWHMMKSDACESFKMVKNPATDMSAIRYLFSMIVTYGERFGYEAEFVETVKDRLDDLAPYSTGKWIGLNKETVTFDNSIDCYSVASAYAEGSDGLAHNMENPELYIVYPFAIVDAQSPADEYQRALTTFELRSNPHTWGWSQCGIQSARLHRPETFGEIVQHMDRMRKFPFGGWDNCARRLPTTKHRLAVTPYLDSMTTGQTAIQEALLQSHNLTSTEARKLTTGGPIRILPAVADEYAGSFRLRARGGFLVTAEFSENRQVTQVQIESERGEDLVIQNPFKTCRIVCNGNEIKSATTDQMIYLKTEAGDVFSFFDSSNRRFVKRN